MVVKSGLHKRKRTNYYGKGQFEKTPKLSRLERILNEKNVY
jgi:hypothetical protein